MPYAKKRVYRRKKATSSRLIKKVTRSIKRSLAKQADHKALSWGASAIGIGTANGVIGTGSFAMNDYLMNGNSTITVGTAEDERLGNVIRWKYLEIDLLVTVPSGNGVRLIVAKSQTNYWSATNQMTSNLNLTAGVESATGGIVRPVATGAIPTGYFYQFLALPEKRGSTVLRDMSFTAPEPANQNTYLPIKMKIPLNYTQHFSGIDTTRGSFFVYLVAENSTTQPTMDGTIRAVFTD